MLLFFLLFGLSLVIGFGSDFLNRMEHNISIKEDELLVERKGSNSILHLGQSCLMLAILVVLIFVLFNSGGILNYFGIVLIAVLGYIQFKSVYKEYVSTKYKKLVILKRENSIILNGNNFEKNEWTCIEFREAFTSIQTHIYKLNLIKNNDLSLELLYSGNYDEAKMIYELIVNFLKLERRHIVERGLLGNKIKTDSEIMNGKSF